MESMQDFMLAPLRAAEIWLVPTGSRFFGTAREDSDYDFLLWEWEIELQKERGINLKALLLSLGWREHSLGYGGTLIRETYRRNWLDTTVDIMIVSDILQLIKARDLIKFSGVADKLTKRRRNDIWGKALQLAGNRDMYSQPYEELRSYVAEKCYVA